MVSVSVGRFHIDRKGAGRIYIPKDVTQKIRFRSGDRVLVVLEGSRLIIKPLLENEISSSSLHPQVREEEKLVEGMAREK